LPLPCSAVPHCRPAALSCRWCRRRRRRGQRAARGCSARSAAAARTRRRWVAVEQQLGLFWRHPRLRQLFLLFCFGQQMDGRWPAESCLCRSVQHRIRGPAQGAPMLLLHPVAPPIWFTLHLAAGCGTGWRPAPCGRSHCCGRGRGGAGAGARLPQGAPGGSRRPAGAVCAGLMQGRAVEWERLQRRGALGAIGRARQVWRLRGCARREAGAAGSR